MPTSARQFWCPRRGLLPALLLALCGLGCGLTVTNERPSYEELDEQERAAVDIILQELSVFNSEVESRAPPYSIENVVDAERISVSFEGLIFSWNFGDETIHVSTWENLAGAQRKLVGTWFQAEPDQAEQIYKKLFYEFMAVVQGAKQYMYNVLSVQWVFAHRTLFSIERDSIETALTHYEAVGRKAEMWGFLAQSCAAMRSQYDARFADKFTKDYFNDNFAALASPDDPSGYMYFICRWIEWGKDDLNQYNFNLTKMLLWLEDLPN